MSPDAYVFGANLKVPPFPPTERNGSLVASDISLELGTDWANVEKAYIVCCTSVVVINTYFCSVHRKK